jgi:hypothetical protein
VAGVLAAAEPRARAADDDVATAQILFEEGRRLVAQHDYERACPKFAESQRLSPGIGTEYNLADCWEHTGRLASAWGAFLEVADLTHRRTELDREQAARARADALAPKLGRLAIEVPVRHRLANLEVRRDGEVVGEALWGVAVPVDAGEHRIEARAPGRSDWSTIVHTSNGQTASLPVPELPAAAPAPAVPTVPPGAEIPPVPVTGPGARKGPSRPTDPGAGTNGSPDRTLPVLILGSALVFAGVGVTGLLEYNANVANFNANSTCGTNLPTTPTCDGYVSTANSWQTVAIVSFVAGGIAAVGGVTLWLLTPAPPAPSAGAGAHLMCGGGLGSFGCVGRF